ncbi:MAG: hypothetical protein HC860_26195 [Alkalinema sp. RU_4_3]|nr:hypothetical protein [Alkalinema sp. RU_4_3]
MINNQASQFHSLVLNLTRVQTLIQEEPDGTIAKHLIRESQFFIEWTVPTMDLATEIDFAADLVDLQRLLGKWKLHWEEHWENEQKRLAIIEALKQWCDRLQQYSQTQSKRITIQAS